MKKMKIIILQLLIVIFIVAFFSSLGVNYTMKEGSGKVIQNSFGTNIQTYEIKDNFWDSDEFSEFRKEKRNINKLGKFYNNLNKEKDITVMSVFNQPLYIENHVSDKRFYYNTDEFIENNPDVSIGIKSLQINKQAFEFYDIADFDWENMNYIENKNIPIIMGGNYKEYYNRGDIIKGEFYGKDVTFEIKNFLKEYTYIDYQNNDKFYLDDYIIVPYPLELWEVNENDFEFESILYFAMINCNVITQISEDKFIDKIKDISIDSEFKDFSVIKKGQTHSIRDNNAVKYIIIYIVLFALLVSILALFGNAIAKINAEEYKDKKRLDYRIIKQVSCEFVLSFIISCMLIKLLSEKTNLICFGIIGTAELITVFGLYKYMKFRIKKLTEYTE